MNCKNYHEQISYAENRIVDHEGYFPSLNLENDENVDEFLMKLNWTMNMYESYKTRHKELTLRILSIRDIILDLQNENKELEKENAILRELAAPGEITRTIYEMRKNGEL